nr:MAG TPA: hypothetical protein [Bacteriophage sp.]
MSLRHPTYTSPPHQTDFAVLVCMPPKFYKQKRLRLS